MTGTGLPTGPDDLSRVVDNKITGPADSFGFQIIAGEHVGAGAWMYHCHVQSHSDTGMAGLFLAAKPDGTIPGTSRTIRRARRARRSPGTARRARRRGSTHTTRVGVPSTTCGGGGSPTAQVPMPYGRGRADNGVLRVGFT